MLSITLYIKENVMDQNKLIIRNVIRVIGIIAAAATAVAGFAFRAVAASFNTVSSSTSTSDVMKSFNALITTCNISRVCAIVLFVLAAVFVVYDIIAKAYPISIGAIGLVIAAIAFIGNFLLAPGSSLLSLTAYALKNGNLTTLEIGSYMVIAGGVFYASYHGGCMKKGK